MICAIKKFLFFLVAFAAFKTAYSSRDDLNDCIDRHKHCMDIWNYKIERHDMITSKMLDSVQIKKQENLSTLVEKIKKKGETTTQHERSIFDPFEPTYDCTTRTRVGNSYFGDGPKFMCDVEAIPIRNKCLVYSIGSNGDFSFERGIKNLFGCEIHTFDPTAGADRLETWQEESKLAGSSFHNLGIWHEKTTLNLTGTMSSVDTFKNVVAKLGHNEQIIDVLKIDCEGCEFSVFTQIWEDLKNGLYSISQILIEVHAFHHIPVHDISELFIKAEIAGFLLFSKERNGWGTCDGYRCVEFSFIHRNVAYFSHKMFCNGNISKIVI